MHEEKSHDWEEIYANCEFGATGKRRSAQTDPSWEKEKKRKRWSAKGYASVSECEKERQTITSEWVRNETYRKKRNECAKNEEIDKKMKKLYRESRPPCLPGGPHICIVKTRLVNDKIRETSLRGEIIRPVRKCKLLRNFLPSPPFRARYFWQIFREAWMQ